MKKQEYKQYTIDEKIDYFDSKVKYFEKKAQEARLKLIKNITQKFILESKTKKTKPKA